MNYNSYSALTDDELKASILADWFYIFETEREHAAHGEKLHDYFFDDIGEEIKAKNLELEARMLPKITEEIAMEEYDGEHQETE